MAKQVDVFVGQRIRVAREFAGLLKQDLSGQIGVTMQQFGKYETGTDRVPASKLSKLGQLFKLPIAWFFDGFSVGVHGERTRTEDKAGEPSRAELLEMFERLRIQS